MRVLITGVYGYIGSHLAKKLKEHGYTVHGIDESISTNNVMPYLDSFLLSDVRRCSTFDYDSIIHLAGKISVEESVRDPWKYYSNNVDGTHNMITNCCNADNYVFASTATAFNPASPYAYSKVMCEDLIRAYCKNYTIFRFFNVAGSNGEFGQIGPATHLVRIAAEAAAGKRDFVEIYGVDWDTEDGTCVRDYIHVEDLVDGIVEAVKTPQNTRFDCVGTGRGYSVLDVVSTMIKASGRPIHIRNAAKRDGDVAKLLIPPEYGRSMLVNPRHSLEDICRSAYEFERNRHG